MSTDRVDKLKNISSALRWRETYILSEMIKKMEYLEARHRELRLEAESIKSGATFTSVEMMLKDNYMRWVSRSLENFESKIELLRLDIDLQIQKSIKAFGRDKNIAKLVVRVQTH